jgi:LytS/YehU family sensor histidine kinase
MNDSETQILITILIVALIGLLIAHYLLNKKANQLLKSTKKLEKQKQQLEAEGLKYKLQPHTLINLLSNLKAQANKLSRGMEALSDTLDYIIYKGENHVVTIEEEVEFIKKFLNLNDLFVPEIDAITFDSKQLDDKVPHYTKPCIPHLISAYFLENAFKHGNLNHPEFLRVEISLNKEYFKLLVRNKVRGRRENINGGLGLENMKKRLELLMPDKFEMNTYPNEEEYQSELKIIFK